MLQTLKVGTQLRRKLDRLRIPWERGSDTIVVDRAHIIDNSLEQLPTIDLKKVQDPTTA